MNGSDFRRSGAQEPTGRAEDASAQRTASSGSSRWRESQPLPQPPGPREPRRANPGSTSGRGRSWPPEPALDPRRLMPPPRPGRAPEKPPVQDQKRPSPPSQPQRLHNTPLAEPRRAEPAPLAEQAKRPAVEPKAPVEPPRPVVPPPTEPAIAKAPAAEPESKRAAKPAVREPEPEVAPARRFIAPTPAEPVREQASLQAESHNSPAPSSIEIDEEPEPRRKGGHLWEKLRERSPLFRGEGRRGSGRSRQKEETSFVPQRLIAPSPIEPAPEQPSAVTAIEPEHPVEPSAFDPEFASALARVIAPPPAAELPELPPLPPAEVSGSLPAPAALTESDLTPQQSIVPPASERQNIRLQTSTVAPKRSTALPPFASELEEESPVVANPAFARQVQSTGIPAPAVENRNSVPPLVPGSFPSKDAVELRSSPAWERRQSFARAFTELELEMEAQLVVAPTVESEPQLPAPEISESVASNAPVFFEPEAELAAPPVATPLAMVEHAPEPQPFSPPQARQTAPPAHFEPEPELSAPPVAAPPPVVERASVPLQQRPVEAGQYSVPVSFVPQQELEARPVVSSPAPPLDWWEEPQQMPAIETRPPSAPPPLEPKADLRPQPSVAPPPPPAPLDWWEEPLQTPAWEARQAAPPPPIEPEIHWNQPSAFSNEHPSEQPPVRAAEAAPAIAPPSSGQQLDAALSTSTPSRPPNQAPERQGLQAAETRSRFAPPSYEPELELQLPHLPDMPPSGHVWERPPMASAGPKGAAPGWQPDFAPDLPRAASFPVPELSSHWPPQAEEPRHTSPPGWWADRLASAPMEVPPEPKPSYRPAAVNPTERPREWAPLSASVPPAPAARPSEPAVKPRVAAPPPGPELNLFADVVPEERDPEKSRTPAIPKLLKRLMTSGRTEFPAVPEFVSAEDEMAAAVLAESMASLPPAAYAASHNTQVPTSPMPRVELKPVGDNLDDLRLAHRDLRNTVTEQNGVLERVQDQVQILCETSDRSAQEQQQLVGELKFFSKWAFVFAIAVALLLFASVAFDVVLLLRQ